MNYSLKMARLDYFTCKPNIISYFTLKTMKFYLFLKLDQFAATCLTSRYLLYCFRQNEKRGNIGEVNET